MSSTTAHYNLVKASSTEQYDVGVVNSNLNMIDEQMYQNATTPFTGATSNTDGAVGNVPTPLISDKDKYLKGDGTWDTPSGGGGGSSTLSGLSDVSVSSPTNGQVLKYNSTTSKWENANESGGTQITVVERTDSTSAYAWLYPKDANGNDLSSDDVTILSLVGIADMSGSPPYYNGLNLQIDSDNDLYCAKLYNSQTGGYATDGVYSVTYRVAYISNT